MLPFASCKLQTHTHTLVYKRVTHDGRQTLEDLLQPQGVLKWLAAMKYLAAAAKVSEDVAKRWLTKQALWQVYLPGPRYIPSTQVRCLAAQCRALS